MSRRRRSSINEAASKELNDSEGRLGIDDILEIDPWKDMEKFETEQVGLIQGIIDEFSEKMRIDHGKKRKYTGKRRTSSGPLMNKASSSSIGIDTMKRSVGKESINKRPNNNFENLEKSLSTSSNYQQFVTAGEPTAITMEERINELIKIDNEKKRKVLSNSIEIGGIMKKTVEREPIDEGQMINKATSNFVGIGAKKKSVDTQPTDNSKSLEKSSSSVSSSDEQPTIAIGEPKAIMTKERISEKVKIDGGKKGKSSGKSRASSGLMMNRASINSVGIGMKKKSVENSENLEKSSSFMSSSDEQFIAADEPKIIAMKKKVDTAAKTTIDHAVTVSNATSMPQKSVRTEKLKSLSKTTEKLVEKNATDQTTSIDRPENITIGSENIETISSESANDSQEIKHEKITSNVEGQSGQHRKRDTELPLNTKKSKIDRSMKNRRRKDEKLAKAFEKFGKKFARASHKMGFCGKTRKDDSSSSSDADESSNSSSSSSSTSSTSSSYYSSSCDCSDCLFESSCSCSSCCTDDNFTEFTLTSSSDCGESDTSSSYSENDKNK